MAESPETDKRVQVRAKIGPILYDRGVKPGTHYADFEPGNEFRIRVRVSGSGYKSP